jgi:ribulose-phosphate 3-epimerase
MGRASTTSRQRGDPGMKIVPAILTDRLEELQKLLGQAEGFADYVQIDFMDGLFVPSRSVSPRDLDGVRTSLACEAHVMVEKPSQYVTDLARFGFSRTIFHYEAGPDPRAIVARIRQEGMEAGVAVNPETDISDLENLVLEVDSVLFMSVKPGFYGSPFIPTVLEKIQRFRQAHPSAVIGIDGGVGFDNLPEIRSAGVDYACVGSRIFLSENPMESFSRLTEMAGR